MNEKDFTKGDWIISDSGNEHILHFWYKNNLNVFRISKEKTKYKVFVNGSEDKSVVLTNDNIETFKFNLKMNDELAHSIIDSWFIAKEIYSNMNIKGKG